MNTQIFVNLPVKDLDKSKEFFTRLGFSFNPQFTDEKAACMIISEDKFSMLIVEKYFKTFIKKEIADSAKSAEVIISLSVDSREAVDEFVKKAFAAGGKPSNDPMDEGFMYSWSFLDLDNHIWEFFYMEPNTTPNK